MYAVIQTGGKQYKVAQGDVLKLEKLDGEAGQAVVFDKVLMLDGEAGVQVGTPLLDAVTVAGEILEQTRADKIIVFKKKRRHNYRRRNGHRQDITVVRITGIGGVTLTAGAQEAAKPKKTTRAKAESAAVAAPADAQIQTEE
jgi:large subunit ribosomal protein L21